MVRCRSVWCSVSKLNGNHSSPNGFPTAARSRCGDPQTTSTSAVAVLLHAVSQDVRIRLTRKLANALNGLDLRAFNVGEVVDLNDPLARMLIAESWAEEAVPIDSPTTADDRSNRPKRNAGARRRAASRAARPVGDTLGPQKKA